MCFYLEYTKSDSITYYHLCDNSIGSYLFLNLDTHSRLIKFELSLYILVLSTNNILYIFEKTILLTLYFIIWNNKFQALLFIKKYLYSGIQLFTLAINFNTKIYWQRQLQCVIIILFCIYKLYNKKEQCFSFCCFIVLFLFLAVYFILLQPPFFNQYSTNIL